MTAGETDSRAQFLLNQSFRVEPSYLSCLATIARLLNYLTLDAAGCTPSANSGCHARELPGHRGPRIQCAILAHLVQMLNIEGEYIAAAVEGLDRRGRFP